jgi:phosphotransferase system  glucose/maltose/N-acetylglucosamine-specific IIC component
LLPPEEPWLCVAAIYGAVTFLLAPALGSAMTRLFDYGWPLFLLYLPAIIPRIWRNWPIWCVSVLVALHLVAAWTETAELTLFRFDNIRTFAILIGCNLVAALLLARMTARQNKQPTSA